MELNGAVAVVTGASSGFGELTALALAREGASVALAARRVDRLEAVAGRIRERGGRALAVRCDVIEVRDLEVAFRTGHGVVPVVRGLSYSIASGENRKPWRKVSTSSSPAATRKARPSGSFRTKRLKVAAPCMRSRK